MCQKCSMKRGAIWKENGKYKMSDENIQNDNKMESDQENCCKREQMQTN